MEEQNKEVMETKISTGAKVGYFFLSWLPTILCMALQLLCGLIVVLPAYVVALVKSGIDPTDVEAVMELYMNVATETITYGVSFYHVIGVFVFGLWYYLLFKKPRPKVFKSYKALSMQSILVAVIAGIGLCFFANATVVIESFLLPSIVDKFVAMSEMAGFGTNAFIIIATIVLAPIGEEFICRGITLKYAKRIFSKFWMANCLQALMFGVMHGNWVQGIYAFFIGLVLGWITEKYKTILPAMIVHFVVNLSSSTWVVYVLDPLPYTLLVGIVLMLVSVVIVGGAILFANKSQKETVVTTE